MRKLMTWTISVMLVLAVAQPAGAQFPNVLNKITDKGKKFADANKPWNPDQEEAIGEASAAKIIGIFGLYDNADMQKYVNLVGSTVSKQGARHDINYKFGILDTEMVNAMAMPGGFVFVTRGALANMKNEAELAGTLAHEVAHVDGKHLEKEIKAKGNISLIADTAQEQVNSKVGWSAQQLVQLGKQVVVSALTLRYSRDRESEADKRGMEFAAKAGYNSTGLRDFLQVLSDASGNAANKRALGAWSSTHPPFPERVSALNALLPQYPAGGQNLPSRFLQHVNAKAFAAGPSSTVVASSGSGSSGNSLAGGSSSSGGGPEYDGIVSKGVIILIGGQKLPEGSRVKVRPQ
jgi:predicted Zn-dependent protease